jgi:hypothetical protein
MLAVAVQLPAAVLADEASGAAAIATIAQIADAAAFTLTMRLPLSLSLSLAAMDETSVRSKGCACLTRPLNEASRLERTRAVVKSDDGARTQNGHIRNDTRDALRRILDG